MPSTITLSSVLLWENIYTSGLILSTVLLFLRMLSMNYGFFFHLAFEFIVGLVGVVGMYILGNFGYSKVKGKPFIHPFEDISLSQLPASVNAFAIRVFTEKRTFAFTVLSLSFCELVTKFLSDALFLGLVVFCAFTVPLLNSIYPDIWPSFSAWVDGGLTKYLPYVFEKGSAPEKDIDKKKK